MRRKERKNLPSKYILLVLTIFCIVIIGCSIKLSFSAGPVSTAVGYVFVPMQKSVNVIGKTLSDIRDSFISKEELKAENQELTEEINSLREELNMTEFNEEELANLKELYDMDKTYYEYDKVAANIIGKDAGNWFSTFVIDKGTDDGIQTGMNVIADGGLCGIVIETGANFAKVRSIIDDTSNVSAKDISTEDLCIVSGSLQSMNESNLIEFSDLRDVDGTVAEGDQLVTSNISDLFLEGIPIGYITDVQMDSNNLTKSGHLATIVDFEHLESVFVILTLKQDTTTSVEGE